MSLTAEEFETLQLEASQQSVEPEPTEESFLDALDRQTNPSSSSPSTMSAEEFESIQVAAEGSTMGRFRSGFNSFAGEAIKGVLERVPKFYAIGRNLQQAAGLAPLTQDDINLARDGQNPFDPKNDRFYKFGQEVAEFVEEFFATEDKYQEEFFTNVVPQALGSVTGSVLSGVALPVVGSIAHGIANISSIEYEQAIESGASQEEAFKTFMLNIPVGATEAIPINKFLGRLDKVSNGGIKEVLAKGFKGGLEEMTQEVIQNVLTNQIASVTYDETRGAIDGVLEAAKAGGFVGLLLNAVGVKTRQIINSPSNSIEEKAEAHYTERRLNNEFREFKSEADLEAERAAKEIEDPLDAVFGKFEPVAINTSDKAILKQDGTVEEIKAEPKTVESKYTFVDPFKDESSFRKKLKLWLTPKGLINKEMFDAIVKGNNDIVSAEVRATSTIKRVQKILGKHYKNNKIPKELENRMNDFLEGKDNAIEGVPDEFNEAIVEMRDHIDTYSQRLLETGLLDEKLQSTVANNIGFYLHKTYRIHKDPNWNKKVDPQTVNRAVAYVKDNPIEFGLDSGENGKAEAVVLTILNSKQVQEDILFDKDTTIEADLNILKRRKNIPEPIQHLLGVVEDPLFNYMETMHLLSRTVNQLESMKELRRIGEGKYFYDKDTLLRPAGYDKEVSLGESGINPLKGLVTSSEILESLRNAYGINKPVPNWLSHMLKATALAKVSKTILNPITHYRNFWGGVLFNTAQGHFSLFRGKKIADTLMSNSPEATKEKAEWAELGLVGQSVGVRELNDLLRDAGWDGSISGLNSISRKTAYKAKDLVGKAYDQVAGVYQGVDDLMRVIMYQKELNRYSKALGTNVDDAATKDYVASIVKDVYPNYSQVPLFIRNLRRNPLIGTFVTFPYEVTRNTINTARLIRSELGSDNNKVKLIGLKRLMGFLATTSIAPTIATSSAMALGIFGETEDDIEELAPPWDKNRPKFYTNKGDGIVSYFNLGYVDPFQVLRQPVVDFIDHGDEGRLVEASTKAIWGYFKNFVGVEIASQAAFEALSNTNSDGRDIVNPILGPGEQVAGRFGYFLERAFEPGFVSEAKRYVTGNRDEEDLILMFFGLRETEIDFKENLSFRVRDFDIERRQAKRIANSKIFNPTASAEERNAAKVKAQAAYDKSFDKLSSLLSSARRLGVRPKEIDQILKDQNIGAKVRQDLRRGRPSKLEFSQGN